MLYKRIIIGILIITISSIEVMSQSHDLMQVAVKTIVSQAEFQMNEAVYMEEYDFLMADSTTRKNGQIDYFAFDWLSNQQLTRNSLQTIFNADTVSSFYRFAQKNLSQIEFEGFLQGRNSADFRNSCPNINLPPDDPYYLYVVTVTQVTDSVYCFHCNSQISDYYLLVKTDCSSFLDYSFLSIKKGR